MFMLMYIYSISLCVFPLHYIPLYPQNKSCKIMQNVYRMIIYYKVLMVCHNLLILGLSEDWYMLCTPEVCVHDFAIENPNLNYL